MVHERNSQLYKQAEVISVCKQLGSPQEMASAVVFLASPAAPNMTAVNLHIVGGGLKTVNF